MDFMSNADGEKRGRLYLSATPIGNLEDMTYRAVRMLGEADLIAAEDTRHTRKLLSSYDIHTPATSYHEHNKLAKGPELVRRMLAGDTVVCVSDAGLPGISDPGAHLAALAIEAGIDVSPLPGANAALSALICSGLDTAEFTFYGFLPKSAKKRRQLLERIRERPETLIFYEAPHHLQETLAQLCDALGGERPAAAARELTKRYEEFSRGSLAYLRDLFLAREPRGEFVLIVSGFDAAVTDVKGTEEAAGPAELVGRLEAEGVPRKEAMREAAKRFSMSRRDVYSLLLKERQAQEQAHRDIEP